MDVKHGGCLPLRGFFLLTFLTASELQMKPRQLSITTSTGHSVFYSTLAYEVWGRGGSRCSSSRRPSSPATPSSSSWRILRHSPRLHGLCSPSKGRRIYSELLTASLMDLNNFSQIVQCKDVCVTSASAQCFMGRDDFCSFCDSNHGTSFAVTYVSQIKRRLNV